MPESANSLGDFCAHGIDRCLVIISPKDGRTGNKGVCTGGSDFVGVVDDAPGCGFTASLDPEATRLYA